MKKRASFRHLTENDRDRLHALYGQGHKQKEIADVLGVHPGTISRELQRYGRTTWRYSATRAQEDADSKRKNSKHSGMKIETNRALRNHIIKELKKLRSPDEISGRLKIVNTPLQVGTNAIYKWLYSEDGKAYCQYLCTRRSRKKKQSRLGKKVLIPDRISFRNKPDDLGMVHAEGDLFVSPYKTKDTTSGLLIVIPETHLLTGRLVPNKTKSVIVSAIQNITKRLPLDTCTFDNGIENIHHREFGVDSYFCDRGAPWQKPHVESSIGLIRRWFLPKGTKLSTISEQTFQAQLHVLNSKYRKSLGYRSSYEVALEQGIITKVPRISLLKVVAFR